MSNKFIKQIQKPTVSVVMAIHNRSDFVAESIVSILNQSYKDFEFIIIDDASTDETASIAKSFAQKDKRIRFFKNNSNLGLIKTLNKGLTLARGKYIARMDDDDISLPTRFLKQVKYLNEHPDCAVVGSFVEAFPYGVWPLNVSDSDELEVILNFCNCIAHPAVMLRKAFLDKHNLRYGNALYAEDYNLWKDILLKGGKIYNIPEILLKVRNHKNRVSIMSNTTSIMLANANKIKKEMLRRFFRDEDLKNIIEKIRTFPKVDPNFLLDIINQLKQFKDLLPITGLRKFEQRFIGIPSEMNIFFSVDNQYSQHVAVTITSILKSSLTFEKFNFYILDGGISSFNKKKILQCKSIKDCNIEFLSVDESLFSKISLTKECPYISKSTYFRYIIPLLKPNLKKCFYFDGDIVVKGSLNEFWNTSFNENYIVAIEDLWHVTHDYYSSLGIKKSFNAGVYLINVQQWNKDNITQKLFDNTIFLAESNLLRWNDQDALNYTLNGKVKFIAPKYNLQYAAFCGTKYTLYTDDEMYEARENPIVIHYTGTFKPWHKKCTHPLKREYFKFLKISPYHLKYRYFSIKKHIRNLGDFIFKKQKININLGFKQKFKIFSVTFLSIKVEHYSFAQGFSKESKLFGINLLSQRYENYMYTLKIFGIKCHSKTNWFHFFNDKFDYLWYSLEQLKNK